MRWARRTFSPTGRIAFSAREKGGPIRIYVQKLDEGPPRAISPEGVATDALPTPDGRFVVGRSKGKHMLYPVDDGAPRELPFLAPDEVPLQWSTDGRFVYVRRDTWPPLVDRIEMATGKRHAWRTVFPADTVGVDSIWGILITPDGQAYCHDYMRLLSQLYLVEGLP